MLDQFYNDDGVDLAKSYVAPSVGDVHVNTALTNISIAFMQSTDAFVAGRVFPEIPVNHQANSYFEIDRGEFNRDEAQAIAAGAPYPQFTWTTSTSSYLATVYGGRVDIPDQVRDNADSVLSLDTAATELITRKLLIKREVYWATNFFSAGAPGGIWTFDVDGVASSATAAADFDPTDADNNNKLQWNDASSTPIEDIRQGKTYVEEATGFEPNTLTLGKHVYDTLLDHPDIVGRIDRGQTTNAAKVNLVTLADLFEVENVYVCRAIRNTAAKGAAASHSYIGGKHALLTYRPPSPGLMTPSAGYTFNWTPQSGGENGIAMLRYRVDDIDSDRIRGKFAWDQKKISADLGYIFTGIVA